MSGLWTAYMDSPSSARSGVIQNIIKATPTSISEQDRKGLVQNILDDIESKSLSNEELPTALLAVKTLARLPEGSAILVKQSNLRLLCSLCQPTRPAPVASEALRCVANALLLIDSGRDAWLEVDGGKLCLDYLMDQKTNEEFCFLNARILFLSTLKQCAFLKGVVEDEKILECLAVRCETLLEANVASKPFSKEALTDVLKFIFNLLLQYPRMVEDQEEEKKLIGEQWNERFEPLIPPLIHLFTSLPISKPPLTSPLTHVIHALLNVPVSPYSTLFFAPSPPSSSPPSIYNKTKSGITNGLSGLTGGIADPFQRAMSLLSSQRKSFQRPENPKRSTSSTSGRGSPSRSSSTEEMPSTSRARSSSPASGTPIASKFATVKQDKPTHSKSDSKPSTPKAESFKPAKSDSRSSLGHRESMSVSGSASSKGGNGNYLIVNHACALLDSTLATYWPGTVEADAASVRNSTKLQGLNLDETITPLVVLLTRLTEDSTAKAQMKEWILPENLDRTQSLEGRGDTLGRCLRLLTSVYWVRLKDALGEWLFALCDNDASALSAQIGYGNAAGYLFNKGILSAPPPPSSNQASTSSSSNPNGDNINPITGMVNQERDDGPEMTDEEKEREAERLFVLFDRLERSGMVQNPVRKAIQEGKISMGPFGP